MTLTLGTFLREDVAAEALLTLETTRRGAFEALRSASVCFHFGHFNLQFKNGTTGSQFFPAMSE